MTVLLSQRNNNIITTLDKILTSVGHFRVVRESAIATEWGKIDAKRNLGCLWRTLMPNGIGSESISQACSGAPWGKATAWCKKMSRTSTFRYIINLLDCYSANLPFQAWSWHSRGRLLPISDRDKQPHPSTCRTRMRELLLNFYPFAAAEPVSSYLYTCGIKINYLFIINDIIKICIDNEWHHCWH